MNKNHSILAFLCAVVLLILSLFINVIGYQSVKSTKTVDSPLFTITMQRAIHQKQNLITSRYPEGRNGHGNDTIPPITKCNLEPSEPDGENSWYVSMITVMLNATDDESGVNITQYQINGAGWQVYLQPFTILLDGFYEITYFSVDNAGNIESPKIVTFALDRTRPQMCLNYSVVGGILCGYGITFYALATDEMSSMNRTEFYFNDVVQKTILGPGPQYAWDYPCWYKVRGFIRNPEITDESVKFYARFVKISGFRDFPPIPNVQINAIAYDNAGNWIRDYIEQPTFRMPIIKPGFYLFRDMTLPSNYTGVIGDFFIWANFYNN